MTTPPSSPWGPGGGWPSPPPAGTGYGGEPTPYPLPMTPVAVVPRVPPSATGGRRGGGRMLAVFVAAEFIFIVVSLLAVVPFAVADPSLAEGGPLPGEVLLVALAVPTLLAAAVAVGGTGVLGGGARRGRLMRELALAWNWRDVGIGLVLGIGGLVLTIPAAALWAWWVGADDATSAVGEVFDGQPLSPGIAVTVFLVVWLVAPLCEEVLYRGVLWRAFEHWCWNRWLIFAVTTVVFSLAHLELLRTPLLLVVSIPIGLARALTGNLLSSVVAHQANNFLPAIGLLLVTLGVAPT